MGFKQCCTSCLIKVGKVTKRSCGSALIVFIFGFIALFVVYFQLDVHEFYQEKDDEQGLIVRKPAVRVYLRFKREVVILFAYFKDSVGLTPNLNTPSTLKAQYVIFYLLLANGMFNYLAAMHADPGFVDQPKLNVMSNRNVREHFKLNH